MADSAGRTRCRRRHRLKSRAVSNVASPCNHQRPAANFNAGRSTLRSPRDMAARMDVYISTYRCFLTPFSQRHGRMKASDLSPPIAEAYARKPTWAADTKADFLGAVRAAF